MIGVVDMVGMVGAMGMVGMVGMVGAMHPTIAHCTTPTVPYCNAEVWLVC